MALNHLQPSDYPHVLMLAERLLDSRVNTRAGGANVTKAISKSLYDLVRGFNSGLFSCPAPARADLVEILVPFIAEEVKFLAPGGGGVDAVLHTNGFTDPGRTARLKSEGAL